MQRNHTGPGITLTLFFFTSMVESLGMSHVFAFLPVYLIGLHVQHIAVWVGILSALTFVVGLPLVPMWGVWADRVGGKAVIVRSAYVEMAVFLLFGCAHRFSIIVLAMMLVGFQLGNTGIMLASLRRLVPDEKVGYAVSVFSVSSPVGNAVGPLLGGWLIHRHLLGLHGLYLLDAVLSFVTGSMLVIGYREHRLREHRAVSSGTASHRRTATLTTSAGQQIPSRAPSAWRVAMDSVRFTFSLRITWTLFGIYTLLMVARQMINPYIPVAIMHLDLATNQLTLTIGLLMGLTACVGAIITIIAGRLGDAIGFQKVLIAAFVAGVPAAWMMGVLHSMVPFVIVLTLFSAVVSLSGAMIFALFSTRIPESHRSTALNLVYLPLYLGGIVGPFLASGMSNFSIYGPFMGGGAVFLMGAVLVVYVSRSLQGHKN